MPTDSLAEPLDIFGQFVMENLRDRAISYYDNLARGHWKAPSLQSLQAALLSLNEREREIVRRSIVSAVDHAIHDFLFKLQEQADFEHSIEVKVNGINVEDRGDGLHGEPFGPDGWMAKFSKYGEPSGDD
jgi:hypothetical protein